MFPRPRRIPRLLMARLPGNLSLYYMGLWTRYNQDAIRSHMLRVVQNFYP